MHNNGDLPDIPVETMAETENYTIWTALEPDGENTFHIELGPVTVHFFHEEWQDFLVLIREAIANPPQPDAGSEAASATAGDDAADDDDAVPGVQIELDWGTLDFEMGEWAEFVELIEQL
jgi:hypothetical protein